MATAEGTADAFAPPAGMWFQRLSAGSHLLHVVLQRSDAATFLREHVLLKHAKLVRISCNFDKVAVTIAPPADAPGTAAGSKRRQNRRVDEVVENTAVGEAALKLPGVNRVKKQPRRDTVVWKMWFRCAGGTQYCASVFGGSCPCEVRFTATPALVAEYRIDVVVTARHHPQIAWQPPAPKERVVREAEKDKIRHMASQLLSPAEIQDKMNLATRIEGRAEPDVAAAMELFVGAAPDLVRRSVSRDNGLVPTRGKIEHLVKDAKRAGRHRNGFASVTEWTQLDELLRGPVCDSRVCVHYQEHDPAASEDSEAELFIAIFSKYRCFLLYRFSSCAAIRRSTLTPCSNAQ